MVKHGKNPILKSKPKQRNTAKRFQPPYSHGHLLAIIGCKWDYTFYKWG